MPKHLNLTPEAKEKIKDMLRTGMSARAVGRKLKIGHCTIATIRKEIAAEIKVLPKLVEPKLPKVVNPNSTEFINRGEKVEYHRCEGCGGMVQVGVECLACRVKKVQAAGFDCYMNELLAVDNFAYPTAVMSQLPTR